MQSPVGQTDAAGESTIPFRSGGGHYTDCMRSVAEVARQAARNSVQAMPVQARVDLALRLGDDDRRMLESSRKVDPATAVSQIRRQRQQGRRHSASAAGTGG